MIAKKVMRQKARHRLVPVSLLSALLTLICLFGCAFYGDTPDDESEDREQKSALVGARPGQSLTAEVESRLITGPYHTCMILGTGVLKCWGLNDSSQLGVGIAGHFGGVGIALGADGMMNEIA